ncbi:hypothetical protein HY732_01325 [Candidatus Uhrbacteria bacterium]|nr:hypothetical protein [Candidatus Uhrbacteria bacterium]
MTSESKTCQNCKVEFTLEPEDFLFYKKMKVPAPTWCPDCRFMRRLHWRNERAFFHSTCKKCNKKILSVYSPSSGIVVYCRPCWWSDDWDGLDYGIDFDPSRPFFDQINALLHRVPLPDLFGLYTTLENSEYTNMVGYLKNCYFLTMADWNEDCSYGSNFFHCKDSLDCLMLYESELCYEAVNCHKCYKTLFSIDCEKCTNVSFSKNCIGCTDCVGCVNLNNKQYCIFNIQYSADEYRERAKEYLPSSRTGIVRTQKRAENFWLSFPSKYLHERHSQDVSGDYIYNSVNTYDSFLVQDMENARYCALVLPGKTTECYDHTHYGINASLLYETLQCGGQASNIKFSWFTVIDVMNIEYGIFNIGAKDCFGSVGIKKRQYCILNKQYSKTEYEALRDTIILHMRKMPYRDSHGTVYDYGEFFPVEMSPFAYNASGAQEFFPLNETAATRKGFRWEQPATYAGAMTMPAHDIPDTSTAIPDTIVNDILECEHRGTCTDRCSGAYKILARDLKFYREMGLPLPSLCPNCRHYQRVAKRNSHKLWDRRCMCENDTHVHHNTNDAQPGGSMSACMQKFKTTYPPDKPAIVYCKKCFRAEIA